MREPLSPSLVPVVAILLSSHYALHLGEGVESPKTFSPPLTPERQAHFRSPPEAVETTRWSYRTVQPFSPRPSRVAMLFWMFFRQHVYRSDEVYLLVGDEVVATKAGKHTHGLTGSFPVCMASRCQGQPSSRYPWSASSNGARSRFTSSRSCAVTQKRRPARPKRTPRSRAPPTAQRPGRPQGSKNTPKAEVPLTPELLRLTGMLGALWQVTRVISLACLVLDGHFGNYPASRMGATEESASDFQAAMRCRSVLPLRRPLAGRGPHRKYGSKEYDPIPGNTSKRLRWRDTSRPACTRRNCSTKGSHSR